MKTSAILKLFKDLVAAENLADPEVYLFGSRARKDNTRNSDWDFLILSDKKLSPRNSLDIKNNLCMKFHNNVFYPIDILIKDKKTFSQEKNIPNTIAFAAAKEGLKL